MKKDKPKIGISIGDPHGIGIEVILKTFTDNRMMDFCTPIIYGSSKLISIHRKKLELPDLNFSTIIEESKANPKRGNVINCINEEIDVEFGTPTKDAGNHALISLTKATEALKEGRINALVTAPINKLNIQENKKEFIGHTEFLNKNFEGESLMLMVSEFMKIAFVTGHIPLSKVQESLSKEKILNKIIQLKDALTIDFGIQKPKIAVIGLNPHAGENGMLGNDENETIKPAIEKAKGQNILTFGPYSADSFFCQNNLNVFDGVLAMYHDQGLIPFKTLSFFEGINYTAGLNIIRTSPVHGTAYEISGLNQANPQSFRNSVFLACEIYKKRLLHKSLIDKSVNA